MGTGIICQLNFSLFNFCPARNLRVFFYRTLGVSPIHSASFALVYFRAIHWFGNVQVRRKERGKKVTQCGMTLSSACPVVHGAPVKQHYFPSASSFSSLCNPFPQSFIRATHTIFVYCVCLCVYSNGVRVVKTLSLSLVCLI